MAVRSIHHSSSNWSRFKLKEILEKNKYPHDFYDPIISSTIDVIKNGEKQPTGVTGAKRCEQRVTLIIQYRGNISDTLSQHVRRLCGANVVPTTEKLKQALPSLKTKIGTNLSKPVVSKKSYVQVVLSAFSARRFDT